MPKLARKRPVVIEYVEAIPENLGELTEWCNSVVLGIDLKLYIDTLEGLMHVTDGDIIIKGVHGEFYPCKPDIFTATYEDIGCDFS